MRALSSEWPLSALSAIIPLVLSKARCWHYAKGTSLRTPILSWVWRLSIVAVCVSDGVVAELPIRSPMRLADKLVLVLWRVSASAESLPRRSDR